MKTAVLFSFFYALATTYLCANYEFVRTEEEAHPKEIRVADKRVVLQSLKGLIIAGEGKIPPDYVIRSNRGVEFYRSLECMELSYRERLKSQLEYRYIGRILTFETLEEMRRDISRFYRRHGEVLVVVTVPEQDFVEDTVVITVMESRLGQINVIGNYWFPEWRYRECMSLSSGDTIFNRVVEGDVAWINRNPWRKAEIIYKLGKESTTTDIDIHVRDKRPFDIFIKGDNTGFKVTDCYRISTGLEWGNAFGLDHIVTYQFTAAPHSTEFNDQKASYTVPLPWHHAFMVFGNYSRMYVESDSYLEGKSYQISERYIVPVLPWNALTHEVKVGVNWKRTNNNLVVGGETISNFLVTLIQLEAGYEGKAAWDYHTIDFDAELLLQPWHFGQNMGVTAYNSLRPGAALTYLYLKGGLHYLWQEPETLMGLDIKLRGQVATAPLLPIEMLGLGGFNTIRGYEERAVNVDKGLIINLEIRSPKFPVCFREDSLAILFFFDAGGGSLLTPLSSDPCDYILAGLGPGLRYDIAEWFRARIDLGIRLTDLPSSKSKTRLHFGLIAAF